MAGDAATNTASKIRPSDEQLNQMDAPAQDNTWHDAPDLSKDNVKRQAKAVYGGDIKKDAQDVANAGANAGNIDTQDPTRTNTQAVDRQGGVSAAINTAQRKYEENVDDEAKGEAQDAKERAKQRKEDYRRRANDYFNKKMPQERKDQVIWRLKKMILECQQHPDYMQAVETLLRLAETYGGHGRRVGQDSTGTAQEARSGLQAAERDLRTLIERFANGTSTSDLWASINEIYKDADRDEELKGWFKHMDRYIRRCLLEQGYILEDESTHEWDQLYDHGRYLLRDKYRGHTDRVVDEIKFLADQFDQDPRNKAFGEACRKLFLDLGNDQNGKATFKPHLVKDLRDVIIPAIMENIAYIPVPRIEYSDSQVDAIIENLVLESDNFMPNVAEVASENYFRWGRKKIANKNKNSIELKVSGIQMDLRDVSYHVKRKQGFPSLSDTGVADIILPGDGFSFKIKMSTADKKDRENFFKIDKVDVDVKHLNIKLVKSKHKLLFALFKPMMLKVLRPAMQKAVEKAIRDRCHQLDRMFYQVKQEADRAADEAKANPERAANIYQRYLQAFQRRALQGKEKAQAVAADKKVNVAVTKEDSIFPNIHLPGGISSKATEYKELARKGEKWESPVFSIGHASKSNDIPSAPKIEKKPHPVKEHTNGHTNGAFNGHTNGALNGHTNGAFNGHTNGGTNGATNGFHKAAPGLNAVGATGGIPTGPGINAPAPVTATAPSLQPLDKPTDGAIDGLSNTNPRTLGTY
jgi:hypothetical protein